MLLLVQQSNRRPNPLDWLYYLMTMMIGLHSTFIWIKYRDAYILYATLLLLLLEILWNTLTFSLIPLPTLYSIHFVISFAFGQKFYQTIYTSYIPHTLVCTCSYVSLGTMNLLVAASLFFILLVNLWPLVFFLVLFWWWLKSFHCRLSIADLNK